VANIDFGDKIAEAEALLGKLGGARSQRLEIGDLGMPSKLPFKAFILREFLIHRVVDFAEAAVHHYKTNRLLPALSDTRSVMEAVAVLAALRRVVEGVLEAGSISADTDSRLVNLLLGSRNGSTAEVATNILTHIDKLELERVGFRKLYDNLSERAHPNYAGVFDHYATILDGEFAVEFGANKDAVVEALGLGLSSLMASLLAFSHNFDELARLLPPFVEVCHAHRNGSPVVT